MPDSSVFKGQPCVCVCVGALISNVNITTTKIRQEVNAVASEESKVGSGILLFATNFGEHFDSVSCTLT